MSAVAKRYAVALIATAREEKHLDAVERDLGALSRLLEASPELRALVEHPLIEPKDRRKALHALFGEQAHALTLNLLDLLAERWRMAALPSIVDQSLAMLKEQKGIQGVRVVSAASLTERQREAMRKKLAARTGKTIELDCSEDPGLIGGFRLKLGDLVEDYSLANKLATFKHNVINA